MRFYNHLLPTAQRFPTFVITRPHLKRILLLLLLIALLIPLIAAPTSKTEAAGTGKLWGIVYQRNLFTTKYDWYHSPSKMCFAVSGVQKFCNWQTFSSPWYYVDGLSAGYVTVSIFVPAYGGQLEMKCANGKVIAGLSTQLDCRFP